MDKDFADIGMGSEFVDGMSIQSMAQYRETYRKDLMVLSDNLITHLLFLIYFPEEQSYNVWRNDSYDKFLPKELFRFKDTHRYPDLKFLKHNLYEYHIDTESWIPRFNYILDKKGLKHNEDVDTTIMGYLETTITGILEEACEILHRKKSISKNEYFDILSQYGL